MNIFGFRPFKGRFNLGNSDDIPTNTDGTLIGAVKQINSNLGNITPTKIRELGAYYDVSNLPFTAPKDGFLIISAGHGTSSLLELYVNSGATIEFYVNGTSTITIPLNAGDVVTSNNATISWMYLTFFPYKNI